MKQDEISTHHVTMEDDKLEVNHEILARMYTAIDSRARQLASQDVKKELTISRDGRIKSRFNMQFSNRMAPYLIAAIQQQVESESGIAMKSYFYKLQELVMAQLFGPQEQITAFNIRYEGKLL